MSVIHYLAIGHGERFDNLTDNRSAHDRGQPAPRPGRIGREAAGNDTVVIEASVARAQRDHDT